jgi:acetylxylan esterase
MATRTASLLLFASLAAAQCPPMQIFGARETGAPPGFGSTTTLVNEVLALHTTATAEAIDYPACDGQASCGSMSYADSVAAGVAAVAKQVNAFNARCPAARIVLAGYSQVLITHIAPNSDATSMLMRMLQGAQIVDDAYCGGVDTYAGIASATIPIAPFALQEIAAAVMFGDPRFVAGESYSIGTCNASGVRDFHRVLVMLLTRRLGQTEPRPAGFTCLLADNVNSFCDAADSSCCDGTSEAELENYAAKYGVQAFNWVRGRLVA